MHPSRESLVATSRVNRPTRPKEASVVRFEPSMVMRVGGRRTEGLWPSETVVRDT